MGWRGQPQRGLEPTNLPITSRLRYRLRHWGTCLEWPLIPVGLITSAYNKGG